MKIGIIGAGKVGCSMGKYMVDHGLLVAGYYSRSTESSEMAGTFTGTKCFVNLEEIVEACDVLCIATPDDVIGSVWDEVKEMPLEHKILCHFSGSLSSVVFSGIGNKGAYACSVHPMSAFSDKFTSYQQLNHVQFTMEGDPKALEVMQKLFSKMGNKVLTIKPEKKALYHCGASLVSNFMIGLYEMGLTQMKECGLDEEEAGDLLGPLVEGNVQSMIQKGPVQALTGPIERGDVSTVRKHLSALCGDDREVYILIGRKLLSIAQKKNPGRDYREMTDILKNDN